MSAAVVDRFGGLDILVNNAAVYALGTIEQLSDSDLQRQLAIDLAGSIHCARAAILTCAGAAAATSSTWTASMAEAILALLRLPPRRPGRTD